ncbi:uncharacterized protein LOC122332375 [Puntigrus tetrazona]|uniref:uncharacterized protein LOC122332375 n=1 Tax=Puntigrus tetrazona TaxID=1606681 RepID=UPI001C8AEF1F|nr:uncharacterized protein LOC122332375 [Puntigrus tetrazona]
MFGSNTHSSAERYNRCVGVCAETVSRMCSLVSADKTEALVRSTQSLHHCVTRYFTITNRLLDIINTHFGENFSSVSADEGKSIIYNCAVVRDAMTAILEVSKRKNNQILKLIDPGVYDQIAFAGLSPKDKSAVLRNFHEEKLGVFGNVFLPLVAIQLSRSELENVKPPTEEHDLPALALNLGDLVKSSKSVAKLLRERESPGTELGEATQLVEDAVSVMKPLCDAYEDIAADVEAYVKIISHNI